MSVYVQPPKRGPNMSNCQTCDYKKNPDGGWCYMFREEPEQTCHQHTEEYKQPFNSIVGLIRSAELLSPNYRHKGTTK